MQKYHFESNSKILRHTKEKCICKINVSKKESFELKTRILSIKIRHKFVLPLHNKMESDGNSKPIIKKSWSKWNDYK